MRSILAEGSIVAATPRYAVCRGRRRAVRLLPQVGHVRGTGEPIRSDGSAACGRLVEHGEGRAMRTVRQPAACFAGDDRCIAATIEEHQRLLALPQCLLQRARSEARCPLHPVTSPGSTSVMAGAVHVSAAGARQASTGDSVRSAHGTSFRSQALPTRGRPARPASVRASPPYRAPSNARLRRPCMTGRAPRR